MTRGNLHRLPRCDDPRFVVDVIAEIDAAADTEREPLRCLDHEQSGHLDDPEDDAPMSWSSTWPR